MSGPMPPPQGEPQPTFPPPPPEGQGPLFPAPQGGAMFPPPPPGGPQPSRQKGFPGVLIGVIVVVAVAAIVGGFFLFVRSAGDVVTGNSDVTQAKAGDCARLSGTESKPDYKGVPCDSAEATHIVGRTIPFAKSPCGGDYDEFTLTDGTSELRLCLVPNLVEGACYDITGPDMAYPKVDCGSSFAVKVTKDRRRQERHLAVRRERGTLVGPATAPHDVPDRGAVTKPLWDRRFSRYPDRRS
jgi:hypothetical protein